MSWHEWAEVFRADLRSSGQYIEPDQLQLRDLNGIIQHTMMIDDDGGLCLMLGGPLKQRPRMSREFTREEALHMEHVRNIRRESPGSMFDFASHQ